MDSTPAAALVGAIHELPVSQITGASEGTRSGGTCLSGPMNSDRRSIPSRRARQACPSEKVPEGPACQVR
ncbi:hypothetical protein THTE_0176 [Thermogutta terrifontis]|uniref:Uncharacterized protein n=1 Tax=Thermogutta terrifontis TaxID=1331910 RepID=A0A286R9Y6_9BACT|nr:hypothetical protein THTE_0176 [Thermogutta terrifontis]